MISRILATTLVFIVVVSKEARAEECTISPNEMVGLLDDRGVCHGYKKDFAEKYLHVGISQCEPSPKKGRLFLGNCIVEPPKLTAQDNPDKRLLAVVEGMQGQIDQLRDEMAAQYHELMSEIDNLKSILNSQRR